MVKLKTDRYRKVCHAGVIDETIDAGIRSRYKSNNISKSNRTMADDTGEEWNTEPRQTWLKPIPIVIQTQIIK